MAAGDFNHGAVAGAKLKVVGGDEREGLVEVLVGEEVRSVRGGV